MTRKTDGPMIRIRNISPESPNTYTSRFEVQTIPDLKIILQYACCDTINYIQHITHRTTNTCQEKPLVSVTQYNKIVSYQLPW